MTPPARAASVSTPWSRRVALGLVAMVWLWAGFAAFARQPVYFDDSFISYNYARAFAEGRGFVFNAEDGPLEGFTNFFWVLILAVAHRLGLALDVTSRALGLSCWAATVVTHFVLLARAPAPSAARVAGAVLVGALALPYGFVMLAGSGLETPLASLLIVALGLLLLDEAPPRMTMAATAFGLQLALLLTRPDGALFVGAFGLAVVARAWFRHRAVGAAVKEAVSLELPAAVALAVYLAWKVAYFGDLLPNTYYAKAADVASWQNGWTYWRTFLVNSPQTWVLVPLALLSALRGYGAWLGRYALVALGLYVVYCAKVGADFMYYRFAFEAYPLLTLAALVGVVRLFERVRAEVLAAPVALTGAGLVVMLSTTPPVLEQQYFMQSMELMNRFVVEGRVIGRRLKESLPKDARLATTLAGSIPYFSGHFFVDQWGLNDRVIARQPRTAPVSGRGHVKGAPVEYLRKRGVQLVVDHPTICSCTSLCDGGRPQVYLRLEGDECLRLWHLTPGTPLDQTLCTSADFIPQHVDCDRAPPAQTAGAERAGRGAPVSEEEAARLESSDRVLVRHSFNETRAVQFSGIAFGAGPEVGALPAQSPVTGQRGPYLSSFHAGDEGTGTVELPLPAETRQVLVRVGGGGDCTSTWVGLRRGATVVSLACGVGDEVLRPIVLEAGDSAEPLALVAVDRSTGGWGHLEFDEAVALRPAP